MFENEDDSDSDSGIPMVDPDSFVQQLDAETSGALPWARMLIFKFSFDMFYF